MFHIYCVDAIQNMKMKKSLIKGFIVLVYKNYWSELMDVWFQGLDNLSEAIRNGPARLQHMEISDYLAHVVLDSGSAWKSRQLRRGEAMTLTNTVVCFTVYGAVESGNRNKVH